jgi:uncharacterized membrane protein YjfL (UPF0719 family)
MNLSLLSVGLAKAAFGAVVGAVGIFAASRALGRLLGSGPTDAQTRAGNVAAGVLKAGSLVAVGLLLRSPVTATFDAIDLLYRGRELTLRALGRIAVYATLHLGLTVVVGAAVLAAGTWLFTHLTRDVDEIAEIRSGNVAPAIVLAAVMVVLALMSSPGLQMALDGLLPLPTLGRDAVIAPA